MTTGVLETVVCPWCFETFDIDPAKGALPYSCPNPECGEQCSIGTLRHPSFDPNASHINHGLTTAAASHIYAFSLPYVSGKTGMASGTLVQLGSRCLIATTAHSLPSKPERIECVQKREPKDAVRLPHVIRVEKADGVDVGLIELEADAPQLLGMSAITINQIADLGSGRHGARAWLAGYPKQQLVPHYQEKGILGFCGLITSCEPIDPIAWASVDIGPIDDAPGQLCEEMHALINYSLSEPVYRGLDDKLAAEFAPKPYGMSGGGLWQCFEPTADDALWSPEKLRLIAIQSSWPRQGDHLKTIQVIHWLRLVADTYPELAAELCRQFPRLSKMVDDG
jgi:hypothetical protein